MTSLRRMGVCVGVASLCVAGWSILVSSNQGEIQQTTKEYSGQVETTVSYSLKSDPIAEYHQQMLQHSASNRFGQIVAQYRTNGDLDLVSKMIDTGLRAGEYEILRAELSALPLSTPEIASHIGPERILQTLFTVTPLHIKTYEPLKSVVDTYQEQGLISLQDKDHWYSLVALAKGHIDDYKYFALRSERPESAAIIQRIDSSQQVYTYAPDWWQYGLYAVAMYDAGRYQVSSNLGSLLRQKNDEYLLGHQLHMRNSMKLGNRKGVDVAANRLLKLDRNTYNHPSYQYLQGVGAYMNGDYARSTAIHSQLKTSQYAYDTARFALLIAQQTSQPLEKYIRVLQSYDLQVSDYYALIDTLYPPYGTTLTSSEIKLLERHVRQCQTSISDGYEYICLMGKAGLLYHAGQFDKAKILLAQLTESFPTRQSWELLGVVYDQLGESRSAKKAYIQAVRFDDDADTQERIISYMR